MENTDRERCGEKSREKDMKGGEGRKGGGGLEGKGEMRGRVTRLGVSSTWSSPTVACRLEVLWAEDKTWFRAAGDGVKLPAFVAPGRVEGGMRQVFHASASACVAKLPSERSTLGRLRGVSCGFRLLLRAPLWFCLHCCIFFSFFFSLSGVLSLCSFFLLHGT